MLDGMGEAMRAGDGDRQATADRLQNALAEGRLDLDEYDERLQRAYAAKTYAELDALLADLPGAAPVHRSGVAVPGPSLSAVEGQAARPHATRRWLVETWDSYGAVVGITTTVWLITVLGSWELHYFWPIWVAGPWGAILLWQTVVGLSSGEPHRWAEQQDRRRAAQQAERERKAIRDTPLPDGGQS